MSSEKHGGRRGEGTGGDLARLGFARLGVHRDRTRERKEEGWGFLRGRESDGDASSTLSELRACEATARRPGGVCFTSMADWQRKIAKSPSIFPKEIQLGPFPKETEKKTEN